jgi:transcriptional regulator with XRE-family HTH domain
VADRSHAVQTVGMTDRTHEIEFGARIKSMRELRGLTQERLAELSKLAADTIRRAEHGEFSPSLRTLIKMAAGFAVPVHTLLRDDDDQADELAECIRALPEHEFRIACAMVRVLGRLAAGHPAGEGLEHG